MKSYDETINNVMERINEYNDKKNQKMKTVRRAAASVACILFAVVISIGAWQIASGHESEKEIILPPTRYGKYDTICALVESYTFESAFKESDMVARVRVGNWLGEKERSWITYFEADVIEIYKGDEIGNIVLLQDADSDSTLKWYPLFTYGNELLVFLKHGLDEQYENTYWIIGSYTTVFDVITTDSGDVYFSDRWGELTKSMNCAMQMGARADVYAAASKIDPVFFDDIRGIRYIYSESDVEALIDSIK